MNARKSILVNDGRIWSKNSGPWDITMGAYDGAQVTDLVGLYILFLLKNQINEIDFGLYRDDGLGIHRRLPLTKLNSIKNKIISLFEKLGLKIKTEYNLRKVDFLDVTLDLQNEIHKPYRKPNDNPTFIHKLSNHPSHIKKNLPIALNKRLSELSSNPNIFDENRMIYENALKKSGFTQKLEFKKQDKKDDRGKRNRKRNIIWYTPPYNSSLKTNIGMEFLKLVDKNFPKNNQLSKIFNRKTIKIGYSCTKNMYKIIANHNRKILKNDNNENIENCDCLNNKTCPIPKKCATSCVVYKATVIPSKVNYVGMSKTKFKIRYNNHIQSFKNQNKRNCTTLAQYIWMNKLNPKPNIKWEIVKKCNLYRPGNSFCDLCVSEKVAIIELANNPFNINKRTDIATRCLHRKMYTLENFKEHPI